MAQPDRGRKEPWPGPSTKLAAVMGDPVAHSLSPAIHNAAFEHLGMDWVYLAFRVPSGSVARALGAVKALGISGVSVTMPDKEPSAGAVDALSPTAQRLRAVNTVVLLRSGALFGDSTDGQGLIDALRNEEGFEVTGKRCLVIGAGGAARAVILALAEGGASEVVVANRSQDRAEQAAALAEGLGRVGVVAEADSCDLVVNATPAGMRGGQAEGDLVIDPSFLGPGQLVVDLVYYPEATRLVEMARARGARGVGGIGMLVYQAALQFTLWTGQQAPISQMRAAAKGVLAGDGPAAGDFRLMPG